MAAPPGQSGSPPPSRRGRNASRRCGLSPMEPTRAESTAHAGGPRPRGRRARGPPRGGAPGRGVDGDGLRHLGGRDLGEWPFPGSCPQGRGMPVAIGNDGCSTGPVRARVPGPTLSGSVNVEGVPAPPGRAWSRGLPRSASSAGHGGAMPRGADDGGLPSWGAPSGLAGVGRRGVGRGPGSWGGAGAGGRVGGPVDAGRKVPTNLKVRIKGATLPGAQECAVNAHSCATAPGKRCAIKGAP